MKQKEKTEMSHPENSGKKLRSGPGSKWERFQIERSSASAASCLAGAGMEGAMALSGMESL
jgi:hypothetical protein